MAYDSVKQVVEEFGIVRKQFEEKMKTAFKDIFETFFAQYPEIVAVGWNQYTPYFNDGEPCEFGVGDFYGIAACQTDQDGEEIDVHSFDSAYAIEELNFPYNGKPSFYTYENRHKYSWYEEAIQAYEKASKDYPRYVEICEGWEELKSVLRSIPEEIFLSAFNDHAFVLATKDGINVNEFDHD